MNNLYDIDFKVESQLLEKSYLIFQECIITLKSLGSIHSEIEKKNEKEDLARAMLTFACGGLDSLIKQAIKDTLSEIIDNHIGANKLFEEFVNSEIQNKRGDEIGVHFKLISKLLVSTNSREDLKKLLSRSLTSGSLQSKDSILKVASYFDIPSQKIVDNFNKLDEIFSERNKIIHEMDINFDNNKSRNNRDIGDTINYINYLLNVGKKFLLEVNERLTLEKKQ